MAEYIEREAVLKHLDECKGTPPEICYTFPIFTALECFVKNLPAADVTEVKRAEWHQKKITVPKARGHSYLVWACSVCHKHERKRSDFCPNCGAKMEDRVPLVRPKGKKIEFGRFDPKSVTEV